MAEVLLHRGSVPHSHLSFTAPSRKWPINTEHVSLTLLFLRGRSDCKHLQIHLFVLSWEVSSLHSFSKPILQESFLCFALPILQITLAVLSCVLLFVMLCLAFKIHLTVAYLLHNLRAVAATGEETICSPCHCGDRSSIQ